MLRSTPRGTMDIYLHKRQPARMHVTCDFMRPPHIVCFEGHFRRLHIGGSGGVDQWHSSEIRIGKKE